MSSHYLVFEPGRHSLDTTLHTGIDSQKLGGTRRFLLAAGRSNEQDQSAGNSIYIAPQRRVFTPKTTSLQCALLFPCEHLLLPMVEIRLIVNTRNMITYESCGRTETFDPTALTNN